MVKNNHSAGKVKGISPQGLNLGNYRVAVESCLFDEPKLCLAAIEAGELLTHPEKLKQRLDNDQDGMTIYGLPARVAIRYLHLIAIWRASEESNQAKAILKWLGIRIPKKALYRKIGDNYQRFFNIHPGVLKGLIKDYYVPRLKNYWPKRTSSREAKLEGVKKAFFEIFKKEMPIDVICNLRSLDKNNSNGLTKPLSAVAFIAYRYQLGYAALAKIYNVGKSKHPEIIPLEESEDVEKCLSALSSFFFSKPHISSQDIPLDIFHWTDIGFEETKDLYNS